MDQTSNRISFVAVVLALAALVVGRCDKLEMDEQVKQLKKDSVPKLVYVKDSVRYQRDGTLLTFRNLSPSRVAIVTRMTYRVTDSELLTKISQRHPRPNPKVVQVAEAYHDKAGAMIDIGDVHFGVGHWSNDVYEFDKVVAQQLPPGQPIDLKLSIVNAALSGMSFQGELTLNCDDAEPSKLYKVTIKAIAK